MGAMKTWRNVGREPWCRVSLVLGGVLVFLAPTLAWADSFTHAARQTNESQPLKLVLGKSTIIAVPVPIMRASLANPEVADAVVLSPKEIYVTGKAFGTTNLTLWGKDEQVFTIFDLEVGLDVTRLKEQLRQLLPEEQRIQVTAVHDHVTLSGTVSSLARLAQALAVAEAYAPKKVINFLQVPSAASEIASKGEQVRPGIIEVIKGTAVNEVKF